MSYSPPVITAAGLTIPSFTDIQNALVDSYTAIYGSTVYLGNDSADYQWISALALKLSDNCNLCVLAYNARSPLTAIGADLDSVVKLNGLARNASTVSTATLMLSGMSGTVINNAVVSDANGVLWSLPAGVTIGTGGSVSATAVCQQSGPISAASNTIINPVGGFTAGWTAVTNPSSASVGTPVEADSTLRARQSISVALPSSTRLAGTTAEIKAVPGVTLTNILENQTSVTDSYGNEGHSLTCVVQGGVDLEIATAIFINRGIGPNTQGATVPTMTVVPITDPNSGNITEIGFVRPVQVPIYVSLSVHGLNSGFTTATQTAIIAALVAYLNSLEIGEEVTQSALYGAALSVMPNLSLPLFSIRTLTLGTAASPTGTIDITLLFFSGFSRDYGTRSTDGGIMGTSPTQSLPVSYYSNRLTSEYKGTVEFNLWLSTVLNIATDISNCLQFITSSFDLDYAVGNQLDVLGTIEGVSRTVPFQPSGSVSPVLDDETYRILIKATIANNQWSGKIGALYPIWKSLFPSGSITIIDNQNMTATIVLTGTFSSIIQDLITNDMIIPRPQAVQYNYEIGALPFFGFDRNDAFIAGFDVGKWG